MNVTVLAILAAASLGAPVLAQEDPDSSRRRTTFGGTSPGYGWGNGIGSGTGYSPGTGWSSGGGYGGTWYPGGYRPGFVVGYPGFGSFWTGAGGYYGYYGGGYFPGSWWGDGYFSRPTVTSTAGGSGSSSPGAIDRTPQLTSVREIEEGRRRFRIGDYRGALDSFRSAVVATTDSPVAQAWVGVSLIAVGEGRNADKALRSAVAGGLAPEAVSLDGLFHDDKERVRIIVALAKVGADGSLAAAYALSLSGEPARLQRLAKKDPVARLLLPKP